MCYPIVNVVVHVSDMDRALRFYQQGLRLPVRFDTGLQTNPAMLALSGTDPETTMRLVSFSVSGTAGLTLSSFEGAAGQQLPFERGGQIHVGLRVDDLDAVLARVLQHGGTAIGTPGVVGTGSSRAKLAFIRDPDGAIVELVESRND